MARRKRPVPAYVERAIHGLLDNAEWLPYLVKHIPRTIEDLEIACYTAVRKAQRDTIGVLEPTGKGPQSNPSQP